MLITLHLLPRSDSTNSGFLNEQATSVSSCGKAAAAMAASTDPFEALYAQVGGSLNALQGAHEATTEAEVSSRRNELSTLEWDVQDLREAVSVAGEDPERFGLTNEEVRRRSELVDALERRLRAIDERIAPTAVENGGENAHAEFKHGEAAIQMQVVREQDEQLGELAIAVERIGAMGKGINEELEEQGEMLDDLGHSFENTRSRMRDVHRRLAVFAAETGRGQLCTIVALAALFLVLLFLLVTT